MGLVLVSSETPADYACIVPEHLFRRAARSLFTSARVQLEQAMYHYPHSRNEV